MTQTTLAKRLNVSRAFVCRIENGDVGLPKKHYRAVAKKLRLDKSDLRKAVVKDAETKIRTSI
jgi:DNA-binding XRE family transcriptional regulator